MQETSATSGSQSECPQAGRQGFSISKRPFRHLRPAKNSRTPAAPDTPPRAVPSRWSLTPRPVRQGARASPPTTPRTHVVAETPVTRCPWRASLHPPCLSAFDFQLSTVNSLLTRTAVPPSDRPASPSAPESSTPPVPL